MANKVIQRTSYMPDSRFLLRLLEAYERDRNLTPEIRQQLCQNLRAAAQILMDARPPASPT